MTASSDDRWVDGGPSADRVFEEFVAGQEDASEPELEELCRHHPRLAPELRRMHASWRRLSAVFENWGGDARGSAGASSSPAVDDVFRPLYEALEGRVAAFDRYEIHEVVGRGGMGEVVRVWDRELKRSLAMKRLRAAGDRHAPSTPHDDFLVVGRFLSEAQVTAQLDHPGVLPVHEIGLDPQGRLFFTMPLVEGQSLLDILDRCDLPGSEWTVPRVVPVLQRVCEAIASAHEKGVVHRDVKPSNVMVGRFGEVYVMDWGLAKVLGDVARDDAPPGAADSVVTDLAEATGRTPDLETLAGGVIGTPEYMPPEQARGDRDALGPTVDIYAMGAILYHLLAGRPPYADEGARRYPARVLERVRVEAPAPLDASSRPPELVAVCERAMERDPARRYHTMGEFAADLRAFTENRVVRAYRTGAVVELRKWFARNAAAAWTAVAAIVLVLGGSIWVAADKAAQAANERRLKETADRKAAESERERSRAALEARRARAYGDFFQFVFRAASPLVDRGEDVTARELLERGVEDVRTALRDDPVGLGILLRTMGSTHRDLGQLDDARVLLEESCELLAEELGERHQQTVVSVGELAILYQEIGRFDEAAGLFDRAFAGLSEAAPAGDPFDLSVLKARSNLATMATVRGEYDEAARIQGEVLAAMRSVLGDAHPLTCTAKVRQARIHRRQGRLDAAAALLQEALPETVDVAAERNPDLLEAYRTLTALMLDQRRVEEAYELGREVLEAHRAVFGDRHHYTLMALMALATAAEDTHRLDEAQRLATQLVELRREVLGPEHPETWASVSLLATVHRKRGDGERAERLYRECLDGLLEAVGPDHPHVGIARYNLAVVLGRPQAGEVLELLEGALTSFRRTHAADHPLVVGTLDKLAIKAFETGAVDEAEAYAREAVELAPEGSAVAAQVRRTLDRILESRLDGETD